MTDCVVGPIVGRLFVKGEYTGYGSVDIKVEGETKQVLLKQFEEHHSEDRPVPIVTDIYCDGNGTGGMAEYARSMGMQRMALLGLCAYEDDDEERICVPPKLKVVKQVTATQYSQALSNTKKKFRVSKVFDAINKDKLRKAEQGEGKKKRAKVVGGGKENADGDKKPKAKPSGKKLDDFSAKDD